MRRRKKIRFNNLSLLTQDRIQKQTDIIFTDKVYKVSRSRSNTKNTLKIHIATDYYIPMDEYYANPDSICDCCGVRISRYIDDGYLCRNCTKDLESKYMTYEKRKEMYIRMKYFNPSKVSKNFDIRSKRHWSHESLSSFINKKHHDFVNWYIKRPINDGLKQAEIIDKLYNLSFNEFISYKTLFMNEQREQINISKLLVEEIRELIL